jgi:hypothetical protein
MAADIHGVLPMKIKQSAMNVDDETVSRECVLVR